MLANSNSAANSSPQKGKSKLPSVTNDTSFDLALEKILAAQLQEEMRHGMLKQYHDPPVALITQVLSTLIDISDIRRLIFYPTDSDIMIYPRLLATNETLSDSDQRKLRIPFMALLYLLHAKEWSKMKVFIEYDGLTSLVDVFTTDDVHLKSQALDAFLQITSVVDWFNENCEEEPQKTSRWKMASLANTGFVKALIQSKDVMFPGGSFCALQILAFWLSWVRYFYAMDRKLPVSEEILSALRAWSDKKDVSEEEQELAGQVYADFARLPAIEDGQFSQTINGASMYEFAMDLKQKGNDAYRDKKYLDALEFYSKAIENYSSESTLYCNRAVASFMALDYGLKINREAVITQSISDCEKALALKPDYVKASTYLEKFRSLSSQ